MNFIADEAIDGLLGRKERGLLCMLYIEKAYENLDTDFLLSVIVKMGFGSKWLSWISWCISMVSFSIMVNSFPMSFFQSSRGLR